MDRRIPDTPLISVVMPVYNAAPYIAESISSILGQTYARWEFIIVDGNSTDGSADIIRAFAARDARIRPVFLPHCNQAHALNVAVALVQGDLVAHMEADNISLPERFAVQLDWMRKTGVDICGSNAKNFGGSDRILWFPETHQAILSEMLFYCAFFQTTVMMRADIIKAQLYDEATVFLDYEMWTRLALGYRMGNVQQILVKYRRHPQQVSVVKSAQMAEERRRFGRRFFSASFPQATAADCAAFALVVEKKPLPSLADLQRAGTWLARLAQADDRFVRNRMAGRWLAACQRSAPLGLGCHRLYRQIAPQFGVNTDRGALPLWLLCALRIRPDSRLYAALTTIKRRVSRWRGGARRTGRMLEPDAES